MVSSVRGTLHPWNAQIKRLYKYTTDLVLTKSWEIISAFFLNYVCQKL